MKRSSDLTRFWHRFRKNRLAVFGLCFLTLLVIMALLANVIAPEGYDVQNPTLQYQSPSFEHPMGTDYLGRDNFVRMIYGARISLSIGVVTTVVGTAIAVFIGMMAGFYGGKTDNILMRIMDVFLSVYLAIHCSGGGVWRRRDSNDSCVVTGGNPWRFPAGTGDGDC